MVRRYERRERPPCYAREGERYQQRTQRCRPGSHPRRGCCLALLGFPCLQRCRRFQMNPKVQTGQKLRALELFFSKSHH